MNKRKILSLAMALSIVAIMAVGATLAYFTDTDSAKNTFTVGNVDIAVTENGEDTEGLTFENVMPGSKITKEAAVTNNSSEAAYVRVVVHLNNQLGLYKMLLNDDYTAAIDNVAAVMPGWNINPEKDQFGMRYTSSAASTEKVQVIAVDEVLVNQQSGYYYAPEENYFEGAIEDSYTTNGLVAIQGQKIWGNAENGAYYGDIVTFDDVAWVYYLKMDANSSYTLFEGINPDASFNADDMSFFDGLEINVCADAIQSTGFASDKAAFEELEKAHPLSAWNLK